MIACLNSVYVRTALSPFSHYADRYSDRKVKAIALLVISAGILSVGYAGFCLTASRIIGIGCAVAATAAAVARIIKNIYNKDSHEERVKERVNRAANAVLHLMGQGKIDPKGCVFYIEGKNNRGVPFYHKAQLAICASTNEDQAEQLQRLEMGDFSQMIQREEFATIKIHIPLGSSDSEDRLWVRSGPNTYKEQKISEISVRKPSAEQKNCGKTARSSLLDKVQEVLNEYYQHHVITPVSLIDSTVIAEDGLSTSSGRFSINGATFIHYSVSGVKAQPNLFKDWIPTASSTSPKQAPTQRVSALEGGV